MKYKLYNRWKIRGEYLILDVYRLSRCKYKFDT